MWFPIGMGLIEQVGVVCHWNGLTEQVGVVCLWNGSF